MSEFKVIETQEQLNAIIGERINRAKESVRSEYADYEEIKKQVEGFDEERNAFQSQIDSLTEKINSFSDKDAEIEELKKNIASHELRGKKLSVAIANGIPLELVDRLTGDTEEAIEADARTLAQFISAKKPSAPSKDPEPAEPIDGVTAAFRKLNPDIKF